MYDIQKKDPAKKFGVFSPIYSQNCVSNENLTHWGTQTRHFFSKSWHFFGKSGPFFQQLNYFYIQNTAFKKFEGIFSAGADPEILKRWVALSRLPWWTGEKMLGFRWSKYSRSRGRLSMQLSAYKVWLIFLENHVIKF